MIRRAHSLIAIVVDAIVGPFGWDVYVWATHGRPGIDQFTLRRRPPGMPRPRRLAPRALL